MRKILIWAGCSCTSGRSIVPPLKAEHSPFPCPENVPSRMYLFVSRGVPRLSVPATPPVPAIPPQAHDFRARETPRAPQHTSHNECLREGSIAIATSSHIVGIDLPLACWTEISRNVVRFFPLGDKLSVFPE